MSIDPDLFRSVLGRFASGITVVTTRDDNGTDHGMTVSAFCSVSLDPALVLICVSREAAMFNLLQPGVWCGVNILAAGQEAASRRFADPDCERFDGLGYARGESGVVLLDDALAHLECRIESRSEAGDHAVLVAVAEAASAFDRRPLLYYRGGYAQVER